MKQPNWASNEMNESFGLFDVDGNGYVDPKEIRRCFAKLGENIADSEAEDQLREYDIDGDCQVRCFLFSFPLVVVSL
jgi:Ca2+-binding EF-hand superfamily protein